MVYVVVGSLAAKFRLYGPRTFFAYAFSEIGHFVRYRLLRGSYSQRGEDLVIDRLLGRKKTGFYVDVGASDPKRFNNTMRFYRRGWRGINIEPNLAMCRKLAARRPRDLNLNIGIAGTSGKMTYYSFFPDTLSTFSEMEAEEYSKGGMLLLEKVDVAVRPLAEVLEEHRGEGSIDFLSVDTEGLELSVLESNDWSRFKPTVVCTESALYGEGRGESEQLAGCEKILFGQGYRLEHDTGTNRIYRLERSPAGSGGAS